MKTLLVSIDDLGLERMERTRTPYLDHLLATWWNHPRFVAAPYCSNFRAKVESGHYSVRPENLVGSNFRGSDLSGALPTGPHVIATAALGSSAHVGKWHLCVGVDSNHRGRAGYDEYGGSQSNLAPSYYDWTAVVNGQPLSVFEYATDWVAQRLVFQLAIGRDLVCCHFNAIHKPYDPPPGETSGDPSTMLRYLDGVLARVIPFAMSQGYAILLTSDNGGTDQDGGKGNLGHRALSTMLAVHGFRPLERPVVDATDLHATVIHLVNGAPPAFGDGVSLLDAGRHRAVAFADLWTGVLVPPPQERQEAATDGTLKVVRRVSTGAVRATDWFDRPTDLPVDHLLYALDNR